MWLGLGRRIAMIVLVVTFATGLVMPAVHAGSDPHGRMAASVVTSVDHHSTCPSKGCPIDQRADMHGTCFAAGAGASALPSPMVLVHFVAAQDVLTPSFDLALDDRTAPPDPYPPKRFELI